jgi:hypothetical protein
MSTQQVQLQELSTSVNLDDAAFPFQIIEIQLTQECIEKRIAEYEVKYGLTSEEFYQLWLKGESPDTVDTGGWAMMYEILQERKSNDLE